MSCILTSINDATLKNLILKYGAEEGLKQHIKNIEVFEKVLKNYRKEVSSEQQTNIKKRIKEYNEQNNTGYYVNFTQVGQANLYTWELENKRPPALYNAPPKVTYPYKIGVNQWRTEEGDIISQADALMELKSKNVEYSINPETPIKPGIQELFDSNQSLANAVYESLGFETFITPNKVVSINNTNSGDETPSNENELSFNLKDIEIEEFNDIVERNNATVYFSVPISKTITFGERANNTIAQIMLHKNGNIVSISSVAIYSPNVRVGKNQLKVNEGKGIGKYIYELLGDKLLNEQGLILKSDASMSIGAQNVWEYLVKNNKAKKAEDGRYYYTGNQITPQQKQQAQQLYSQYLDTIFPDSKVKDIVYHETSEYSKEKILEQGFNAPIEEQLELGKDSLIWFSGKKNYYGTKNTVSIPVILNSTSPRIDSHQNFEKIGDASGIKKYNLEAVGSDALITEQYADEDLPPPRDLPENFVNPIVFAAVIEPEQIHILGNKQDIEGFKEFVENNPTVEETTTPDVEYSIFFDFPFQEESAEKINKGVKSVTVRPVNLKSGTYNIGNQVYNIKNQGLMRIEDYLSLTGLTLDEFKEKFIQDEEVKYEHIEKFLDNKVALFIYKVEPTTEKSINPQLTPYEKVIKVLKSNLKQLQIEFNKEKNEEAQSFLYEKIKSLKGRIKDLENEDNQILPFLLQQAYQHLDEAAYFVSNGDITLANNYIKTYMDVFPTEDIPEDLLADIKVFNDKLSTLESSVINAAKQLIEKNSKITIGGYEQDKEFASDLLSAATSNNPLVRYAHKKVVDVLNTIDLKKNLFLRALNRNLKLLGKITDPKEFYNWMLQTDENGELTGYTVTKYNHKYIKDKFKAIPNFFKGDVKTKDLEKYIKFLKKNHNIIINEEAYKQYVQEKIDYINKTSLETAEDTLEEVKEKRIYNLLKAIDPNTFLKYVNKDSRSEVEAEWLKRFLKYTRSYITYEVTNEEYFDEKYIAIQNMDDNDPKKVFYNFYSNTIKKARLEDATVKHDVALNYIPELAEDVDIITKLTNLPYYTLSEVPEDKREYFEDPTTGESMMSIPDGNMLNRELSAKNKSYNLGEVLEKFITASINKSEKDKIENEMKIVMEVVKNQQEFRVVNNQIQYKNGKPELKDPTQNNAYNQLKYFIEATLYDKRQEKERPFGKLRYDPILEKKLKQAEIDFENGLITEQELLKIKKERDATGKVITGKKLTNTLISYTAIKSLAFNMFSGIAELFQSSSSIFIEAASGRYFNDTDVKVGYSKAISTLRDSEELQLWFDNFPLINNFGYETPSGKWVDKAFWFFRQSEKLAKSALLFSRLNAIKITDVNGQEFSLLDVIKFDENGTAYLDGDFTESFEIGSEFRNTVLNQLHALSRTLLARDNTRDPIRLNRKWYGRLAGQFRSSWLFEGITRRIGGLHVTELGEQKGYYNTVFFNNGNVDVARAIKIILAAQFHPEKLADLGIEGIDLDNVKKALREFKLAMALLLIYGLAKALAGFDDDEDEWDDVIGSDFIINSAWRFNRDLTYFVNPESAIDLIGSSPMASISTIKQGMDLLKAVVETTFGDPYLYEDTKRERLKIGARIEPLIPVYSGVASTIKKFTESD